MNARKSGLEDVSSNTQSRRIISEFGAGHRVVGLLVVLIALVLGIGQWMEYGRDATVLSAAQQEPAVRSTAAQFEYFPAQYVNQATEISEHIGAF